MEARREKGVLNNKKLLTTASLFSNGASIWDWTTVGSDAVLNNNLKEIQTVMAAPVIVIICMFSVLLFWNVLTFRGSLELSFSTCAVVGFLRSKAQGGKIPWLITPQSFSVASFVAFLSLHCRWRYHINVHFIFLNHYVLESKNDKAFKVYIEGGL